MFLFPGLGRPNLCGMTDAILDSQLIQQLQEPLHRTGGFDLDHDQPFQGRIKFSYSLSFVVNYLFQSIRRFRCPTWRCFVALRVDRRLQFSSRPPSLEPSTWVSLPTEVGVSTFMLTVDIPLNAS